jgi:hypothetical protein
MSLEIPISQNIVISKVRNLPFFKEEYAYHAGPSQKNKAPREHPIGAFDKKQAAMTGITLLQSPLWLF